MANDKILAVVGGRTVTERDLDEMIAGLGSRGQDYDKPRGRQILLEQIINKELVLMDAKKNLLELDPEFKAELEKVKNELLANFYVDKILREIRVTEADAKKYFDEHPEEFKGEETISASHILVDSPEKAEDIRKKIDSGEMDFAAAAKAFSSCPSAQNGGDLGEFGRGQMVPEFESAAFSMQPGEISHPVQTQFGFHLIRLDERHPAKAPTFEEAKEGILRTLTAEKQKAAYQSKMNQLRILYPVDRSGLL